MTAELVNFGDYKIRVQEREWKMVHQNLYLIHTYIVKGGPIPDNLKLLKSGNREALVGLAENFSWMKEYASELDGHTVSNYEPVVESLSCHLTEIDLLLKALTTQFRARLSLVNKLENSNQTIEHLENKLELLLKFLLPYSKAWERYAQNKCGCG